MDQLQHLQLRIVCLEMAKQVSLATHESPYSITSTADEYWKWVTKELPEQQPIGPAKSDDDIPF